MDAYTGLPGAGKSYAVVANVLVPAIKAGRIVYTNIPLNLEEFRDEGLQPDVRPIPEPGKPGWADIANGAVIAIDEAWNYWPSGTKATAVPEEEKEFFSMHRHKADEDGNTQQIVVLSQTHMDFASFVRGRVDKLFVVTKLDAAGQDKRCRVDIYQGNEPKERRFINDQYLKYDPDIYRFYKSHTQATGDVSQFNEKRLDKRASGLNQRIVKWGIPLSIPMVLGGAYLAFQSFTELFSPEQPAMPAPVVALPGDQPGSRPLSPVNDLGRQQGLVPAVSSAPSAPNFSTTWRLAGEMYWLQSDVQWLIAVGRGGLRYIDPENCQPNAGQLWCSVDGEIVTEFTGPRAVSSSAAAPVLSGSM